MCDELRLLLYLLQLVLSESGRPSQAVSLVSSRVLS